MPGGKRLRSSKTRVPESSKAKDGPTTESVAESNQQEEQPQKLEQWTVEKVVAKRVSNKKTEYMLKWYGYPDSENSWEPVGPGLDCPDLIKEFNEKLRSEQREDKVNGLKKKKRSTSKSDTVYQGLADTAGEVKGFARGLPLQSICGMVDTKQGAHVVLCQWRNCDEMDFLPAEEVFQKYPNMLLRFLQARITGKKSEDDD